MALSPDSLPPSAAAEAKAYNEQMRRWMAKQSFWYRLLHARRHPDADGLLGTLFRFSWKLAVVLVLGGLVFYGGLHRHLDGSTFHRHAIQEFAIASKAHSGRARSVQWKGGILTLAGITLQGAPESFYVTMRAESARVPITIKDLFEGGGNISEVTLQGLDIELRGGALSVEEQARVLEEIREKPLPAGHVRASAGLTSGWPGITLQGAGQSLQRLSGRNSTIHWGVGLPSEGSLSGVRFEWKRESEGWRCVIESGVLRQSWLRSWRVDHVVLVESGGVVTVEEGRFLSPNGAKGELSGKFTLGGAPEIDLRMVIRNVPVGDVVRDPFRSVLTGYLDLDFTIKGVLNSPGGVEYTGRGNVSGNLAFRPDLQGALALFAVLASRGPSWPLQAIDASEGEFNFTTGKDKVVIEDFRLFGAANIRINGGWEYDAVGGKFSGKVDVNVEERIFSQDDPVRERLFSSDGEGLLYLEVPLEGYFEELTVLQAERAAEVRRQTP